MSITVNGEILQRRDTTEAWEYVNPILPDGQLGWEKDIYGNPLGVKMGDGTTHWNDLPYWFESGGSGLPLQVPFIGATGFTVTNWQTNMPTGYTDTYARLCGNSIKQPTVYVLSGGSYIAMGSLTFSMTKTGALINTITFDWGSLFDGYIQF